MKLKLLLIFAIFLGLFLSLSNPPKAYASTCTLWGGTNYNVGDFIIFFGGIDTSNLNQEYHLVAISQTNGTRTNVGNYFSPDITFFMEAQAIPTLTTGLYTIAFEQKFGGDMSSCGVVTINGTSPPPSKVPPPPSKVPPPSPPPSCPAGQVSCAGTCLTPFTCPDGSTSTCNGFGLSCPPPPVVPPPVVPPPVVPPPVVPPPVVPPPPAGNPPPAGLIAGAPTISLPGPPAGSKFTASAGLPSQIISGFLGPIITILGFLTVFYIIFAGIKFIISRGNPEAVAEARNRLIYAVVGFIVLLLTFVALQIVNRLFLGSGVA